MTAGRAGVVLIAAAMVLGACGTTFVEVDDPVRPTATTDASAASDGGATAEAPAEPSADDSTADLLAAIENRFRGLDQEIIDDEAAAAATLTQIESAWSIVRPRIDDDTTLFNFEQAIELARTGVERRRPADASKGLKIFAEVADAHLDR